MSKYKNILLVSAVMAMSSGAFAQEAANNKDAPAAKKEKCFGIVKAGKNDCAAADGSHSCAGLAKNDGGSNEWVLLPSGTCERVLGGSVAPKS